MRWWWGIPVVLAVDTGASAVSAEPEDGEQAKFALAYKAASDCPSAEAFVEQVMLRVGNQRIAASADDARTLRVAVRQRADGFVGTLSINESVRTLRAQTCAEAVKALALAAAIIIDPEAALNPKPVEEAAAQGDATASDAEPAKPAPDSKRESAATPAAGPPVVRDRVLASASSERTSFWLSAGPSLDGRSGIASDLALALGAFIDVELSRESPISPALRLAGSIARVSEVVALGSAEVELLAIRLDGCPIKLSPTDSLAVQPCAAFEIGQRSIVGRTSSDSAEEKRLWAAPGALVRGRVSPLTELAVELQVAGYVPLDRTTITFADASTNQQQIRSAPAIALSVGVAVAARFSP